MTLAPYPKAGIAAVDRYLEDGYEHVVGMSSRLAAAVTCGLMRIQGELGITGAVAEIGSAPLTPDADGVFLQRGIEVLPGILCNGGGVTVSYFEWLQNRSSTAWTATQVRESLAETMVAAARRVKLARHRYECDLRTAASCAALEQIARVYDLRGIWP